MISGNEIFDNGNGIMTYNGCRARIEDNQIHDNYHGVGIVRDADPRLSENVIKGNEFDVWEKQYSLYWIYAMTPMMTTPIIAILMWARYYDRKNEILDR